MEITRLHQLIAQLFEIGTIISVDEANARYMVQIGDEETANTQYLHALSLRAGKNKSADLFEAGEQVLLACPSGDIRQAIILGALYSDLNPSPSQSKQVKIYTFEDGTVISYDKAENVLNVDAVGAVNVTAQTVTITAETVNITSNDGDVVINGVSLVNHTHPQTNGNDLGGDTNTSQPNQVI